jgi:DNA polymerase Ligase (LigD)
MPRYVILEHDHPALHWDFMLEAGAVLRTWRLAGPPQPGQLIPSSPSFDHRLAYLDYEGPVSGNRGRVVQWDQGVFQEITAGLDQVKVELQGRRLRGIVTLGSGTMLYEPRHEQDD